MSDNYLEEVSIFFEKTKYNSVAIVDSDENILELYKRNKYIDVAKWLNIENKHLVELLLDKKYQNIEICITDDISEKLYHYIKFYEKEFASVSKNTWSEMVSKTNHVVIVNEKSKMSHMADSTIISLSSMVIELEYRLLLVRCKKQDARLYVVSIPNKTNVWNLTDEEKRRIESQKSWKDYLEEQDRYSKLLGEVFSEQDEMEAFIDSCMNLPPTIRKNELCYQRDFAVGL